MGAAPPAGPQGPGGSYPTPASRHAANQADKVIQGALRKARVDQRAVSNAKAHAIDPTGVMRRGLAGRTKPGDAAILQQEAQRRSSNG